ncbi:MAG: hypothetical protein HN816_06475, partial [Gammaproteobacteria bacterium]|nr:hypothetical protein [Gammaproteobacteria bacterium]
MPDTNRYKKASIHLLAALLNLALMVVTDQSPRVLLYAMVLSYYLRPPTIAYLSGAWQTSAVAALLLRQTRRPTQYDDGAPIRDEENKPVGISGYFAINTLCLLFLGGALLMLQGDGFLQPEKLVPELLFGGMLAIVFWTDDIFGSQLVFDPDAPLYRNLAYNTQAVFIIIGAILISVFITVGWSMVWFDLHPEAARDESPWAAWIVLVFVLGVKLTHQVYIDIQEDAPRARG